MTSHPYMKRLGIKIVARFKQRVIYYLLSHVNSCPLTNVKTSIMKILGGISTTIKLQMLLPALKGLLKDATEYLPDKEQEQDEYNALLVSSFDESSAKSLNDPTGSAWELYTQILRYFFQIGEAPASWGKCITHLRFSGSPSSPRKALTHNLRRGLQSLLNINRQMELCQLLLEFCQRDQNLVSFQ